jgi:tetratricopeptide (TPR) repeat protein
MALMQIGLRTFDDAEAGLAEALSLAAETRSVDNAVRGSLHAVMGEVLYRTGRLAEALESIERGRESWESVLAPGHVRFGLADSDRAVVLAKLGRTAEARQSVESARNTFERGVGLQYSGMRKVLWAEALIAESEGDLDGAEDVLRKWVDFSHEEGRSGAVEALLELARIQVRQRAYDRAEHSLLRARLLCDQSGECPAPELELLEERLGELR